MYSTDVLVCRFVRVPLVFLAGLALCVCSPSWADSFDHSHEKWNNVLQGLVVWNRAGVNSLVDYELAQSRASLLHDYLGDAALVERQVFEGWTQYQQLAFLINLHNASALKLILDYYPLESVEKVGLLWRNPRRMKVISLFGEKTSSEDVVGFITQAGVYDAPYALFALSDGSVSSPALRDEPYVATRLDAQLADSVSRFLGDITRNRFNRATGLLEISPLFRQHEALFQARAGSVRGWLAGHADALRLSGVARTRVTQQLADIRYLDYDWRLNALPPPDKDPVAVDDPSVKVPLTD